MELLEKINRGYPAEYLLARIRGRRAFLIRDWEPYVFGTPVDGGILKKYHGSTDTIAGEAMWRNLADEYRWIYSQMEPWLQGIFRPFFEYTELRTLFLCFRYRTAKEQPGIEKALRASILSKQCKDMLIEGHDLESTLGRLEKYFSLQHPWISGLASSYLGGGLRAVEELVMHSFLVRMAGPSLHKVLRMFFTGIIDSRNIISLSKHLRWETQASSGFIPGGRIRVPLLMNILNNRNFDVLLSIVRTLTREKIETLEPAVIENAFYRGLTKKMVREGRDISGIGTILDYLWRCSLEAMNLSIIFHGRMMKRDFIAGEVIR